MSSVYVTGAAGFIGYHVCRRWLEDGHTVIGIDQLNNYYDVQLKKARIRLLQEYPRFVFHAVDLANREPLRQLFQESQPDIVIHLAAQAGVRYSLENPDAYIASNVSGLLHVLECCRQFPVKHLLFASSSSVYGDAGGDPCTELQPTDRPVSLYAATKKTGELMTYTYSHLYHIPTTVVRFFTVYGPWGRPDMAYFLFTERILRGHPIPVFHGGQLKRDYTYVNDAVEALTRLAHQLPEPSGHRIYNIGNRNPVLLLDFIAILERLLGREAILDMKPMQPGDVTDTFADTTALRLAVDFEPSTPLEAGLSDFVSWYRSYYQA